MPLWVLVVDPDHWPRVYLRAELIERGFDADGYATVRDAALALALARTRRPALIVVDLSGAEDETLVGALFRSGAPVVAVAGAAARDPGGHPWAAVLRRPVTIGAIADAVERLAR
jgi:ActR/RegA family two-component response regulator